jgi:penicillin-binding protein 2
MKVIGATAVTDTGIYDLDKRYYCAGTWRYEDDVRYDWWPPGHGSVDVREAIKQSCNPFFYEAGFQLNAVDPMLLPGYARRMGLGDFTGIGALAEAPGFIPDPEWARVNRAIPWSYADAVNMAIGQGEVEVTPLQIARLYAAIASGGTLYRPQIVQAHGILEPTTVVSEPEAQRTFDVDPAVLARVQDGLCAVTRENFGTARSAFARPQESPTLSLGVCGKTGTAETNQATPHSWFVAYAPADNPEIVVTVLVENAGDGSAVAAPITRQILEYYFFLRDEA